MPYKDSEVAKIKGRERYYKNRTKILKEMSEKGKIRRSNDPKYVERIRKAHKKYYEANKEKVRLYREKRKDDLGLRKYGITKDEYWRIFELQRRKCKVCGKEGNPHKNSNRPLVVDHSHVTGKVRGLLCRNCNSGIGLLQDNVKILKNAVKYLEAQNAREGKKR